MKTMHLIAGAAVAALLAGCEGFPGTTAEEPILPGGVESEVVATPSPADLEGEAEGVADVQEACRTGNFAAWRQMIMMQADDDQQVQQDAFRLLSAAQTANDQLSCEEALATLASQLQGVAVGTTAD